MKEAEKRIAELSGVPRTSVLIYPTIDSTNTEARRLAEADKKAPLIIIAKEQSGGRGRMGRSFYSPDNTGLYMTVLLEASHNMIDNVMLTTSASVAVCRAVEKLSGIRLSIKWVNDLYLNGKKICGILCESFEASGKRFLAVGVGVNISTADFPSEISDVAGSLGVSENIKNELAAEIFAELWRLYNTGDKSEMIDYYKERSIVLGKRIFFVENGVKQYAEAIDIDEYGRLAVRLDNGKEKILSSGEITVRLDVGE